MLRLFAFLFLATVLQSTAQENSPSVAELRETISKIVDVQTLESQERLDWQAKRAEMQSLLELHRRELDLLDEELSKSGQSAPAHVDVTVAMKSEIESLKKTRAITAEAVAKNVPRTLILAKRFPEPLLADAETELANLRSWKPADDPREALRSILALLAKAEQFNRRFTRVSEVRDGREVEVLYLGLARAFYADRKDKAGFGEPGTDGWTWKSVPEIRSELLAAFDALDKKRPPSMVKLPLEIH